MWKPQNWGFWKVPAVKKLDAVVLEVLQSEYVSIHPPGHLQASRTNPPISSALLEPFSWVQTGKWLLITWIFQAVQEAILCHWLSEPPHKVTDAHVDMTQRKLLQASFRSLEMMVSRSSTTFSLGCHPVWAWLWGICLGQRSTKTYLFLQNKSLADACCWMTSSQALLWPKEPLNKVLCLVVSCTGYVQ